MYFIFTVGGQPYPIVSDSTVIISAESEFKLIWVQQNWELFLSFISGCKMGYALSL